MLSRKFVINAEAGLHLRPAAALCAEAVKYKCSITLKFGNVTTNAKSVLNILSACVKCADEITLTCDGEDEQEAMENLSKVMEEGLDERRETWNF